MNSDKLIRLLDLKICAEHCKDNNKIVLFILF